MLKIWTNKKAHKLAPTITKKGKTIKPTFYCFSITYSICCKEIVRIKVIKDDTSLSQSKTSYFIKSINKKIPDCYTCVLYNSKS